LGPNEFDPEGGRVGKILGRTSGALGAGAVVAATVALLAAPASAVIVKLKSGKVLSYMPTIARAKVLAERSDGVFGNVDYNGGPVMKSNTNYLIFWSPSGASAYPGGYISGLNRYFTDLAHDSGGHQNTDSVTTQYNDTAGDRANYSSTFNSPTNSLVDTHPYPSSGCGAGAVSAGTTCLIDSQIQAELGRFATANTLPKDMTHEYYLLLPPGVATCFDSNPADGCDANTNTSPQYCAYHGNSPYTPGSPVLIYANDPFVAGNPGCDDGNHPNGISDGALQGGITHERLESVTDPIPNTGWTDDLTGLEIGDKCVGQMGPVIGTHNGADYNQVINGHFYWYQEEWSNQGSQCLQHFTFTGTHPTATFTVSPDPAADSVDVDATGSTASPDVAAYHWQFEDPNILTEPTGDEQPGSNPTDSWTYSAGGTHTIALTVYAPDGTSVGTSQQVSLPTARFTDNAPHPVVGRGVSFDGGASSSANGGPFTYSWDFGDGSPAAAGPTPSHAYAAGGTFMVSLTVTDGKGFKDTVTHVVTVFTATVASFSVATPSPVAGQAVLFDGSSSSSEDASITRYSWSFGDGSSGSGPTASHAYSVSGTYSVRLTVTDNFGNTATSAPRAVVVDEPPRAAIAVRSAHPATGGPVRFAGTGSNDPDGSIISYVWSLGDGSTATGSSPAHIYKTPGLYPVTLSVVDSAGHTARITARVTVVRASKISKISLIKTKSRGFFLLARVTGAGTVTVSKRHVRLRKAGIARFQVHPNGRHRLQETVVFVPVAGSSQRTTATLKVPGGPRRQRPGGTANRPQTSKKAISRSAFGTLSCPDSDAGRTSWSRPHSTPPGLTPRPRAPDTARAPDRSRTPRCWRTYPGT
jgi:PKD repeat protein